uniref:Uncharacterized protein n=1 Tax=viral metagenome TaxID=1070528 RepID=A0A6M3ILG3_9ZZZZ
MKHYFVFAVIQGGLVGFGCVMLLGPVDGLLVAVAMALWGVKSAYDMVRYDKASDTVRRDVELVSEFVEGVEFALSLVRDSDTCGMDESLAKCPETYRQARRESVQAIERWLKRNAEHEARRQQKQEGGIQ